jgi:hypothetical protein
MSAVFEAVGNLVEGVADVVGDALEWVGDTVTNVVESAMDDPLKAIAQVAVIAATSGAGAGVLGLSAPLTAMQASLGMAAIEGIDVLEEGGDLGDVLEASAKSFAVSQAVSFGMDAFSAAGPTGTTGSATSQFFDDGSSIQFFDDGSRLVTDTAGKITSSAADEVLGAAATTAGETGATTSPVLAPEVTVDVPYLRDDPFLKDSVVSPVDVSPVELMGTEQAPFIQTPPGSPYMEQADLRAAIAKGEDVGARYRYDLGNDAASFGYPPRGGVDTAYNSMEDLLLETGAITRDQYNELLSTGVAVAPDGSMLPDIYDNLPESVGNTVAVDRGAAKDIYDSLPESAGNAVAVDPNAKQYGSMEDLLYDKGVLTDAQYKDLTGVAPVVDKSSPAGPMSNVSVVDAAKDLGSAAVDYAIANPLTTAGVIGGGLALAGAVSGDESTPATKPGETAKKTFTYGAAPEIRRTGLDQLYSASANIYGPRGATGTPGSTLPPPVQFQSSFQPLIGGAAPGAARFGLGALGQGFSYTPMGSPQTFDISTLTPEQIVQMQDAMARRRAAGGG